MSWDREPPDPKQPRALGGLLPLLLGFCYHLLSQASNAGRSLRRQKRETLVNLYSEMVAQLILWTVHSLKGPRGSQLQLSKEGGIGAVWFQG